MRANAIAVGAVRAATLLEDAERHGIDPDVIGTMNGSGRLGEPDEIGYGVLFFASDASSFCSGQTLHMHGGPGRQVTDGHRADKAALSSTVRSKQ